jgi:hypothetical protein
MSALLTSAAIQLYFSTFVFSERRALQLLFTGLVGAVAIYGRAQVYKLSRTLTENNTKAITMLLREITAKKDVSETVGRPIT